MLSEGLILVAKRECPTCAMVEPVIRQLAAGAGPFTVYSQDDPDFPAGVAGVVDDRELEHSYRLGIETVPTLLRVREGREVGRAIGWQRREWEDLSARPGLGPGLPESRPGCGSRSVEPGMPEILALRYGDVRFASRRVALGDGEDPVEACFDRGWSDGLPVVPPTRLRVLRMLGGTARSPQELLGAVPPALAPCTVEKAAVNAVMAGCRPEYFPVVLAAIEAALDPAFALHGVLATTDFASPIVVVSGPVARRIGMNSGVNALGQGNRANATIGRALQLVVRNVGGGWPGGVDRSTLGHPGKYTYCFAEDDSEADWEPLHADRGIPRGTSAVTLFAGGGVHGIWDEKARAPEALVARTGEWLARIGFPRAPAHALVLITPEHARIYREAGWDRARIKSALVEASAGKILIEGLLLVRVGGPAGLLSAAIAGWGVGERGSNPITREIGT